MLDIKDIFDNHSKKYHKLIIKENIKELINKINNITDLRNKNIIEFGAGTGRLTISLSKFVNKIMAFENSEGMLKTALANLKQLKIKNCIIQKGDNLDTIELNEKYDLAIEGWSFLACIKFTPKGFEINNAKSKLNIQINNMIRNTRKGAPIIIIESLGTYVEKPSPYEVWIPIYEYLEKDLHFNNNIVRTDFHFSNIEEAIDLFPFFFGDEYKSKIINERKTIIPEFTGIWYKLNDGEYY